MQGIDAIFFIAVLLLSVIIHEISHGYAALYFGDQTAKQAGRLTMNPIKHLDPIGSVLVPLFLVLSGAGIIFGWAKPVPFNPFNLRDQKKGTLAVASAGILANLFIAAVFSLLIRLSIAYDFGGAAFLSITSIIVLVNLILAIFNLIPIPPLDGSKILFTLLPPRFYNLQFLMERFAIFILLIFIFFFWQKIAPIIFTLFNWLTGVNF
jgi:Zn-dependent protease